MSPKARLLAALDHTRLGTDDTDEDIRHFCVDAAAGTARPVAVCVYPQFAGVARRTLDADGAPEIAVAVVANFPEGGSAAAQPIIEICRAGVAGAAEFDLVFPWRDFLAGNRAAVESLLAACRAASAGCVLKVIIETGELGEPAIRELASCALDAGADFIKTSTGRTPVGATPAAARAILETIRDRGHGGFKASGGIHTVAGAVSYLDLADAILGTGWAQPATFRIGASSLLAVLRAE